jgi:hypothetical protein
MYAAILVHAGFAGLVLPSVVLCFGFARARSVSLPHQSSLSSTGRRAVLKRMQHMGFEAMVDGVRQSRVSQNCHIVLGSSCKAAIVTRHDQVISNLLAFGTLSLVIFSGPVFVIGRVFCPPIQFASIYQPIGAWIMFHDPARHFLQWVEH